MREYLQHTPKEVIVVDDDPTFLDIMQTFLFAAYGHNFASQIKTFSDPIEAMAYLRQSNPEDPSLLISDVMMKLPGDVLAQNVSSTKPNMKILLISSAEEPRQITTAPLLSRDFLAERIKFMSKADFPFLLIPYLSSLKWQ